MSSGRWHGYVWWWQGHGGTSCHSPSQVYVRRGYLAYELNSLQHRQLSDGTCLVEFQFVLPSSHPNRYGGLCTPILFPLHMVLFAKLLGLYHLLHARPLEGTAHRALPLPVEQDEPSLGQGPMWNLRGPCWTQERCLHSWLMASLLPHAGCLSPSASPTLTWPGTALSSSWTVAFVL